jgi:transcriptional regulator NrdR family protein
MRVNLYTIKYEDGEAISHYDIDELLKITNTYNALHYPKIKMTLTKIRRYLLGKSHIPKPYKSISKNRLNEILGIDKLSQVNYGAVYDDFVKTNNYSTTGLIPPPSSPKSFFL